MSEQSAVGAPASASDAVVMTTRGITLSALQAAHVARQAEWCPDQLPDLSFRGNELAGEAGETSEALILHAAEISRAAGRASNIVKKLERERHQWRGSRATKADLAAELADVIHCAVLCAITAGIEIEPETVEKFNATSEKQGLATKLQPAALAPPAVVPESVRRRLVDIAQQDRGGVQGIYEDGGDDDAVIKHLLGRIEARRKLASAALATLAEQPHDPALGQAINQAAALGMISTPSGRADTPPAGGGTGPGWTTPHDGPVSPEVEAACRRIAARRAGGAYADAAGVSEAAWRSEIHAAEAALFCGAPLLSVEPVESKRWDLGSNTRGKDCTKYRFWVVRRDDSGQSVVMSELFEDPDAAAAELSRLRSEAVALVAAPAAPEPATTIPPGYRLISAEMTPTVMEQMASNLADEFGPEFVGEQKAFALAVYAEAYASGLNSRFLAAPEPAAGGGREIVRNIRPDCPGDYEVVMRGVELRRVQHSLGGDLYNPLRNQSRIVLYRDPDGNLLATGEGEFKGQFRAVEPTIADAGAEGGQHADR